MYLYVTEKSSGDSSSSSSSEENVNFFWNCLYTPVLPFSNSADCVIMSTILDVFGVEMKRPLNVLLGLKRLAHKPLK